MPFPWLLAEFSLFYAPPSAKEYGIVLSPAWVKATRNGRQVSGVNPDVARRFLSARRFPSCAKRPKNAQARSLPRAVRSPSAPANALRRRHRELGGTPANILAWLTESTPSSVASKAATSPPQRLDFARSTTGATDFTAARLRLCTILASTKAWTLNLGSGRAFARRRIVGNGRAAGIRTDTECSAVG